MRAAVHERYGPPEVMRVAEVERPVPKQEVLVRVYASTVDRGDTELRTVEYPLSRRAKLGIGRYRMEDLALVRELVEAGKYRPVIDRTYALDDIVEANRDVESWQKTGNVVLRISEAAAGALAR